MFNFCFLDVDNQEDFYEGGALAVPGSNGIRKNIYNICQYAFNQRVPIISTVDTHTIDDPEFKVFPPHCIKGTHGFEKIPESTIISDNILWGRNDDINLEKYHAQIILEKATYNIWDTVLGNPKNLKKIMDYYDIQFVIVFGVATNICVKAAVMGMLENHIGVDIIGDACKGLYIDDNNNEEKALEEMIKAGAFKITTNDIIN
jgi:nicotinamidase/pyrazinamidase